jgi:hypothetical protein
MLTNLQESKTGAVSNGEPGERVKYAKGYYAAFVLDPIGNNIETVFWPGEVNS